MAQIKLNHDNDLLLHDFSKMTMRDRYLLPNETFQGMFARTALAYCDDLEHAQRIYDYMSNLWFMPATPVLSNSNQSNGLPISCFLNEVGDDMESIVGKLFNENIWLAQKGGGIGTYWGNVRSLGERVGLRGQSSGIIPFLGCQNAQSLAISQGLLRRGSTAAYLPVDHPEIEEFIEIRRPTGGDPGRKALNLHHGVVITDKFMHAVRNGDDWELLSPHTREALRTVKARELWIRILTARIETGEPYLLFIDNVNRALPKSYLENGLSVKTSNLCSEITLATGLDHLSRERTAVCCLSSLNLEYYELWKSNNIFILDVMRFLDNVLTSFTRNAPESMEDAIYSALRERSVGLGVMGFHAYLQSKSIPFESAVAKSVNMSIFSHIKTKADEASQILAALKGPCPDAADAGLNERFSHKLAIAPTASISIVGGCTSPGIEPWASNASTYKTLSGSYNIKNKFLSKLLDERGKNTREVWSSIMLNEGSVQHLSFLSEYERDVFKTSFEIDQRWLIDHAADRQQFICQAQSLNLFLPATIHKRELNDLHVRAWEKGLKSLYYCRSKSIQRAGKVSGTDDCLACQ